MKLSKMLAQIEERGFKVEELKPPLLTIEGYSNDTKAERPYNIPPNNNEKKAKPRKQAKANSRKQTTISEQSENNFGNITPGVTDKHLPTTKEVEPNIIGAPTVATQKPLDCDTTATQEASDRDTTATQKTYNQDTTATHKPTNNDTIATHNKNLGGRPRKVEYNYFSISGNAKKIVNGIYAECIKNQNLETPYLEKKAFCSKIGVKPGSVRTTCVRLKEKQIIDGYVTTKGLHACWKFFLNKRIYEQIGLLSIQDSDTKSLSSSSDIINTTTTFSEEHLHSLDLKAFQITLKQINPSYYFTMGQVRKILKDTRNNLTVDEIRLSIEQFNHGLTYHLKSSPYKDFTKPGAFLYKHLINGSMWECPYFLSENELQIKEKYDAIMSEITVQKNNLFNNWLKTERQTIEEKAKQKYPSTYFINEHEILNEAKKLFKDKWLEIITKKLSKQFTDKEMETVKKFLNND